MIGNLLTKVKEKNINYYWLIHQRLQLLHSLIHSNTNSWVIVKGRLEYTAEITWTHGRFHFMDFIWSSNNFLKFKTGHVLFEIWNWTIPKLFKRFLFGTLKLFLKLPPIKLSTPIIITSAKFWDGADETHQYE